jgi:hypothetical protein
LKKRLHFYEEIFTGYGNYKVKSQNTAGFGFDYLHILIDFNEEHIINNIWINGF